MGAFVRLVRPRGMLSYDPEWGELCRTTIAHFLTHHLRPGEVVVAGECDDSLGEFAVNVESATPEVVAPKMPPDYAAMIRQPLPEDRFYYAEIDCRRDSQGRHRTSGRVSVVQRPGPSNTRCIHCPFTVVEGA